jgi:hypothetical protein
MKDHVRASGRSIPRRAFQESELARSVRSGRLSVAERLKLEGENHPRRARADERS